MAFCDNISSVYMSRNPVHHRRTKHIELNIHFVREKVAIGELRVTHIPSARQIADVFTKGLPSALFFDFRDSLSVQATDVETAGGVNGSGLPTARPVRVFSASNLLRTTRSRRAHRSVDRAHSPHSLHACPVIARPRCRF